jgi:hypothetical protein
MAILNGENDDTDKGDGVNEKKSNNLVDERIVCDETIPTINSVCF